MKALKLAPGKLLVLIAEIPTARFLEVMVSEGPSNSIFCTSLSMVLSALKERKKGHNFKMTHIDIQK